MSDLIDFVLDAHGGTAHWERATQLSATMRVYGDSWSFKGQPDLLSMETVAADMTTSKQVGQIPAIHAGVGNDGQRNDGE